MTGPAVNPFGWSPGRDAWSREACQRLFPAEARLAWGDCDVEFVPAQARVDLLYGTDAFVRGPATHTSVALRLRGYSHYRRFGDVTLRHDSLQTPGKILETAKAAAATYWYGWANTDAPVPPTAIIHWYVLRLQETLEALRQRTLPFSGPFANVDESSRLIAVKVADLRRLGLVLAARPLPGATSAPPRLPEPPARQLPLI
jgi:hypothetical protein